MRPSEPAQIDDAVHTAVMTDSQLANDRTFLAWLRTGIALFGLGFVVAKVAFLVDPDSGGVTEPGFYSAVGVLVVLCGAAVVVVGHRQHSSFEEALRATDPSRPPRPMWTRTFAVGAAIGAVVLSALIVVTT